MAVVVDDGDDLRLLADELRIAHAEQLGHDRPLAWRLLSAANQARWLQEAAEVLNARDDG